MFSSIAIDGKIVVASTMLYLLLGAASLGVSRKTGSAHSQLRMQVHSWWLLFPAVSLSLCLYPLGPALLTLLIGVLALRELRSQYITRDWRMGAAGVALLMLMLGLSWFQPRTALGTLPWLAAAPFAYFLYCKKSAALLLSLYVFLCLGISFLIQFMHLPQAAATNLAWLFYLFVMTALNDIAQFIAGKAFGRQKIAPRLSPNKTWQGLAGGIACSVLLSAALGSYLQLADLPRLIMIALLLSPGGFLGDILFSAAKRYLRIKDFSALIPGHGGILDRVDSLVVTAPLLYFIVCTLH
ncbi:MAG: phosphatidate cytidylyltransferase [Pseudomonadota bacterium]